MAKKCAILYTLAVLSSECLASLFVPLLERDLSYNYTASSNLGYIPIIDLIGSSNDNNEFWLTTDLNDLLYKHMTKGNATESCASHNTAKFFSKRTVRPICRDKSDYQACPHCTYFDNDTECELFRDSCKERRVMVSEYGTYCEKKYGKYRTMFVAADYSKCRCCDECIFYRELDQSCVHDENHFDMEETLPVTTIDFRAGCNGYIGHPNQEEKALRCDEKLKRCVPLSVPFLPDNMRNIPTKPGLKPLDSEDECPVSCRGYTCPPGLLNESNCILGAFIPSGRNCNCCGHCSAYQQLNQKCAEVKKTFKNMSGFSETEVEEELLEPGCDDGLVCRQGVCQDIHTVNTIARSRRTDANVRPFEPCKLELKYFKKKYGANGHLHFDAPQCTSLWLYTAVQCRRFVCYCALEDGTRIIGIKVPRVEASNMNCDCAREKCRTQNEELECDGFGNYKSVKFYSNMMRTMDVTRRPPESPYSTGITTGAPPFIFK